MIMLAVAGATAFAQGPVTESHDHDHSTGSHPVTCGMTLMQQVDYEQALRNTALHNPELYKRMISDDKRDARKLMSSAGVLELEWEFRVFNRKTNMYDDVTGTLVYDGDSARIWVDNRDLARVGATSTAIRRIARALDSVTGPQSRNPKKGIIANTFDVFGPPPMAMALDGKTDFLLTDIQDNLQGAHIAGYFSPRDQIDEPGSNRMNLLYIDSKEGLINIDNTLGTIAHEFQHLVHYGGNQNSDIVFNEGCSEEASLRAGYTDRTNPLYFNDMNVDMFSWPSGSTDGDLILANYQRGMTFVHYLGEQFGERFFYEFVQSKVNGMERINNTLGKLGMLSPSVNWVSTFKNYVVATYVQSHPNGQFGYKQRVTQFSSSKPKVSRLYEGSGFKAAEQIALERYGIAYAQYNNPGAVKVRFDAIGDYAVVAMMYRGSSVDVLEVQPNQDFIVGQWGEKYDKVIFGIINMMGTPQNINWTVAGVTVGVDDAIASEQLGFAEVSPNPVTDAATIEFTTPGAASTRLEIFNQRGEMVRGLVDGMLEAGRHQVRFDATGLPSGYYFARLTQGDRTINRIVVVAK